MVTCEKCGKELRLGEHPFCPHGFGTSGVQDDTIVGGMLMLHGICNPDGSPKRYDSKTDIARAAEKAGLLNYVKHEPPPGTDKSRHTVRWVAVPLPEDERLHNWYVHEQTLTT